MYISGRKLRSLVFYTFVRSWVISMSQSLGKMRLMQGPFYHLFQKKIRQTTKVDCLSFSETEVMLKIFSR